MRYLHYVDSVVKIPIRPGLEDLPEKSKSDNTPPHTLCLPYFPQSTFLTFSTSPQELASYHPVSYLMAPIHQTFLTLHQVLLRLHHPYHFPFTVPVMAHIVSLIWSLRIPQAIATGLTALTCSKGTISQPRRQLALCKLLRR